MIVDWVWASDVTWLTDAEPGEDEQQTGEQEFTYNVEENTTGETRTGSITFFTTTGNISASIEVTQLAEQVPIWRYQILIRQTALLNRIELCRCSLTRIGYGKVVTLAG